MLKDNQLEAIDYLIRSGNTKQDIAKMVGVSERTFYRWLKDKEFIAKWQEQLDDFQTNLSREAKNKMSTKLGMAIDNIVEIANHGGSEKVRFDANVFIYESLLGKATTKVADVTDKEEKKEEINIDNILAELDEQDNVIKLPVKEIK